MSDFITIQPLATYDIGLGMGFDCNRAPNLKENQFFEIVKDAYVKEHTRREVRDLQQCAVRRVVRDVLEVASTVGGDIATGMDIGQVGKVSDVWRGSGDGEASVTQAIRHDIEDHRLTLNLEDLSLEDLLEGTSNVTHLVTSVFHGRSFKGTMTLSCNDRNSGFCDIDKLEGTIGSIPISKEGGSLPKIEDKEDSLFFEANIVVVGITGRGCDKYTTMADFVAGVQRFVELDSTTLTNCGVVRCLLTPVSSLISMQIERACAITVDRSLKLLLRDAMLNASVCEHAVSRLLERITSQKAQDLLGKLSQKVSDVSSTLQTANFACRDACVAIVESAECLKAHSLFDILSPEDSNALKDEVSKFEREMKEKAAKKVVSSVSSSVEGKSASGPTEEKADHRVTPGYPPSALELASQPADSTRAPSPAQAESSSAQSPTALAAELDAENVRISIVRPSGPRSWTVRRCDWTTASWLCNDLWSENCAETTSLYCGTVCSWIPT
jgi:hypothetical protein